MKLSIVPIVLLIIILVGVMVACGADSVLTYSSYVLLSLAVLSFALSRTFHPCRWLLLKKGLGLSCSQILPTVPILLLIAMISVTWMLGGIVPTIIDYGIRMLNPKAFLVITCVVCSLMSALVGSSWTTCATIGVAFMGIGAVMGYNPACTAGAIISGAYFGDKVSPLSDTTILSSSSAGVELFVHVKYLMITTVPSMIVALIVFGIIGLKTDTADVVESAEILTGLDAMFNISPFLLLAPVVTCTLIVLRVKVLKTLAISAMLGLLSMIFMQPDMLSYLAGEESVVWTIFRLLCFSNTIDVENELLSNLISTGGIEGMIETLKLILSAMIFGGVLLGTGMLSSITRKLMERMRGLRKIVSTTVATGLLMNISIGDQYLSLIVTGNLYKNLYSKNGLEPRLLSRSLEDSISVTSVLIPWNSCGMTQSTVLGVNALHYLPYCVFNYMCPIMSIIIASLGYKIYKKIV